MKVKDTAILRLTVMVVVFPLILYLRTTRLLDVIPRSLIDGVLGVLTTGRFSGSFYF